MVCSAGLIRYLICTEPTILSNIDRIEERRSLCQRNLERAENRCYTGTAERSYRSRTGGSRQTLEDEMTITKERIQKYDRELEVLRWENRRNMLLAVSLMAIIALCYYAFIA
nr:coiled-coil domain-containing protein 167 [Paramormyrops kingsleyae]